MHNRVSAIGTDIAGLSNNLNSRLFGTIMLHWTCACSHHTTMAGYEMQAGRLGALIVPTQLGHPAARSGLGGVFVYVGVQCGC